MAYTRTIYIGGKDFTGRCNNCTFDWAQQGGCERASLSMGYAGFDSFLGIEINDAIDIRYGTTTGTRWWRGIVVELTTTLSSGLTVQCVGTKTLLAEIIPTGRFGTEAATPSVTDMDTTIDSSQTVSGLAAGSYKYWLTSWDEIGETKSGALAAGQTGGTLNAADGYYCSETVSAGDIVTLTWTVPTVTANVKYCRVYRQIGSATLQYIDVPITAGTFEDNGTGNWTDTAITTPGSARTAGVVTIASANISDVVAHLLTTFLPNELTTGTISITKDTELDDFDLSKTQYDLQNVLQALADIEGDVIWGVDEDNAVYFISRDETVQNTVYVKTTDIASTDTNVASQITRTKLRDGITKVKVEAEEDFETETKADRTGLWSRSAVTQGGGVQVSIAIDHRVVTIEVGEGSPEIGTTKAWIDTYATLAAWLVDFPTLQWLYINKDRFNTATIASILRLLRMARRSATTTDGVTTKSVSGPRPRLVVKTFAGIKTHTLAAQAAANWMLKYTPTPERWSITLENVDTLIKPGQGFIRVIAQTGERRDLEVQSVSYSFEDTVTCNIVAGDPVFDEEEEKRTNMDALIAQSMRRRPPPMVINSKGAIHKILLFTKDDAVPARCGNGTVAEELLSGQGQIMAAPADHTHVLDVDEMLNRVVWKDYGGA